LHHLPPGWDDPNARAGFERLRNGCRALNRPVTFCPCWCSIVSRDFRLCGHHLVRGRDAMRKYFDRSVRAAAFAIPIGLGVLALYAALGAQAPTVPKYKFDPDWPKPLPNKWKIGGVTGLAVDKDDNVWAL